MLGVHVLIPFTAFVISIFTWAFVFARDYKRPVNKAFLAFNAAVIIWILEELLSWLPLQDGWYTPIKRYSAVGYLPSGLLFLFFVLTLIGRPIRKKIYVLLPITIVLLVLTFFTDLVITGHQYYWFGVKLTSGPLYFPIIIVYTYLPYIWAIVVLANNSNGSRRQVNILKLVLFGAILAAIVSGIFDILLPGFLKINTMPSGAPYSFALVIGFIFIAITKYRFFSIDMETIAYDMFNNIADSILITDKNGKVRLSNPAAQRLFSTLDLAGYQIEELFEEFSPQAAVESVETVTRLGKPVSLTKAPLQYQRVELGGLVIVRDLTKRQHLQSEIEKRQRIESIGILAGGIAHDFNNILTAMLGNVQMAQLEVNPDSEVAEMLHELETATYMAQRLTKQLLTFSKGGEPIKKEIDIATVVENAVSFSLSGSAIDYTIHAPGDIWGILADESQLHQVISNLTINAKQAMQDRGTIKITIHNVTAQDCKHTVLPHSHCVRIQLIDQGDGIADEHLPFIFDPYYTTKKKGHGLGLASAYSIIARHKGSIEVAETSKAGTTFEIYLPADTSLRRRTTPVFREPIVEGHTRVLIMDDDALITKTLEKILNRFGFCTTVVEDGHAALKEYFSHEPYDLVIMDLTIVGGMGGQETIAELLTKDPEAKVIVSSGYSNDPVMANYKNFGFCGVVEKPYRVETLMHVINRILGDD